MCHMCNGEGATYKDHGFGVEIIPCPNQSCQERNSQEFETGRIQREKRRDEAKAKLKIQAS